MAEYKAHNFDLNDRPTDAPPRYSSIPHAGVPVMHAPVSVMHTPIGVVGTNVGVIGTRVGVVGTNVGVVGTNVGVVGTNVGVVGVNVGHGTTMIPMVMTQQMSPKPVMMTCRSCNMDITTTVNTKPTWKTHFFAGLLCLIGCWCCVCIPYCTESCLNADHYCPNCNAYIGSYNTTYA